MNWQDIVKKETPSDTVLAEIRRLIQPDSVQDANLYLLTFALSTGMSDLDIDDDNYFSIRDMAKEAKKLGYYMEEFYLAVQEYYENPDKEYRPVGIR
tara:strand:- start:37 stop:327 length:291 start_codon:yes stop_codon:yes gene_type:complete